MIAPTYTNAITNSPEDIGRSIMDDAIRADDIAAENAMRALEAHAVSLASPLSEITHLSDFHDPSIDVNPSADSVDGHNSDDGWTVSVNVCQMARLKLIQAKLAQSIDERQQRRAQELEDILTDRMSARASAIDRMAAQKREEVQVRLRQMEAVQQLLRNIHTASQRAQVMERYASSVSDSASPPDSPELVPDDAESLPEGTLEGECAMYNASLTTLTVPELVLDDDDMSKQSIPPLTPMSDDVPAPPPPAYSAMDTNTGVNTVSQRPGTPFPFDVTTAPMKAYAPYVVPFQATYQQSDVPFTFDFRRPQHPTPEQQSTRPILTYSARHAFGRWPGNLPPRAVMRAKDNIPTIVVSKRTKAEDKTSAYKPFFACLPRDIYAWARQLPAHVFPKTLLGTPTFNRNGRINGVTPTGAHTASLANGIFKVGIKTRAMFALAVTECADYRALCESEPLPLPSWTQTSLTEDVSIAAIHRLFHNLGVSPDDVDFALGAVMVFLNWATTTTSPAITPALRDRCAVALYKARVRYAQMRPMPRNYMSYRTALLERILAAHRLDLDNAKHFRASDFPDIVEAYPLAMYQQRNASAN